MALTLSHIADQDVLLVLNFVVLSLNADYDLLLVVHLNAVCWDFMSNNAVCCCHHLAYSEGLSSAGVGLQGLLFHHCLSIYCQVFRP